MKNSHPSSQKSNPVPFLVFLGGAMSIYFGFSVIQFIFEFTVDTFGLPSQQMKIASVLIGLVVPSYVVFLLVQRYQIARVVILSASYSSLVAGIWFIVYIIYFEKKKNAFAGPPVPNELFFIGLFFILISVIFITIFHRSEVRNYCRK